MKVSNDMMNKDIRTVGKMIRTFYKFRKESQFITCNKMLNKFMRGKYIDGINVEERYIENDDNTKLRLLICYSDKLQENATGVLWLHGGGYAIGIPEQELNYAKQIIENTNSVVIIPEYTLSVEKPYPAALNDCYNALLWLKDNAEELGVNPNQLFVAGESAGGGLTAALCLYARDKKEVNIAFQMPLYPMLDCRMATKSMLENNAPVWDYEANKLGWKLYLGELFGSDNIPYYASPSLAEDYSNLPNTYTFVGNIEPFYDETIKYIEELQKVGINAKVDIYDGCFHAFDLFGSKKEIGKKATQKWIEEFKYATENYYSEQKVLKKGVKRYEKK